MTHLLFNLALAVIPVILAITLHEAAHGYAALALGDTTAKDAGRLSLNPIRHIDRFGTIILPGFLLISQLLVPPHKIFFMFGWAKPVPVSAWRFRHPRQGMALVAAAGPAMNFFLAWLTALVLRGTGNLSGTVGAMIDQALSLFILFNLVLGLFNLLPVPPLDGGRIMVGILPERLAMMWAQLERAGIVIVILAVFLLPRLLAEFGINWDPVGHGLAHVLPWAYDLVYRMAGWNV